MADGSDGKGDDKIGYKNPPKHSRFVKGQSGNPAGRPKGSKSIKAIVRDHISKQVQVKLDGKVRSIPLGEAIVARSLRDAATGSSRANEHGVRLMERHLGGDDVPDLYQYDLSALTKDEQVELLRLLDKAGVAEVE